VTDLRKTAEMILAEAGANRLPRLPIEDFAELAREYLRIMDGRTLGGSGRLFVSVSAAREYGAAERITSDEDARRELHELLLDARQSTSDASLWRARKRSTGLDVSARVASEGKLLVVTHVSVRDANVGGRRG
jgi:hypothetical protein